jgi:hypothetical protein
LDRSGTPDSEIPKSAYGKSRKNWIIAAEIGNRRHRFARTPNRFPLGSTRNLQNQSIFGHFLALSDGLTKNLSQN